MFSKIIIFSLFITFFLYGDNHISIYSNGNTLLHKAVLDNNLTQINKLMKDDNVEIDDTNYDGQTALHLAVINNHIQIVELLIDNSATITKFDSYNFSPFYYAEYYSFIDIYNILKRNGAKEKIKKVKKDNFKKFIEDFDNPLEKEFFKDEIDDKSKFEVYKNKGYLKW